MVIYNKSTCICIQIKAFQQRMEIKMFYYMLFSEIKNFIHYKKKLKSISNRANDICILKYLPMCTITDQLLKEVIK